MVFRSPTDRRWAVLFSMRQRHNGHRGRTATSVSVGERRADASGSLFRLLYAPRPVLGVFGPKRAFDWMGGRNQARLTTYQALRLCRPATWRCRVSMPPRRLRSLRA
jgi:hypothetical protein